MKKFGACVSGIAFVVTLGLGACTDGTPGTTTKRTKRWGAGSTVAKTAPKATKVEQAQPTTVRTPDSN